MPPISRGGDLFRLCLDGNLRLRSDGFTCAEVDVFHTFMTFAVKTYNAYDIVGVGHQTCRIENYIAGLCTGYGIG